MSPSSFREPNYMGALPTFFPRGIESILEYNGLIANDGRVKDRIIITSIGGLDDPDVRDTRENNPDRDGETAFDALYGGRTLTLRGYVQAGNYNRMRQLWSSVKDAFDSLVESPLVMRWLDWKDSFVDSNALLDYQFDAGGGTVSVNVDDTGLTPSSTANKILRPVLPGDGTFGVPNGGEQEAIIQFNSATITNMVVGVILRRTGATSHLRVVYEHASTRVAVYKRVAGVDTLLTSTTVTLLAATEYWLAGRVEGGVVTYNIFTTYPSDSRITSPSFTLSGGDLTLFPVLNTDCRQSAGIFWTPGSTNDRVRLLDIGMLNPGDAQISCRKVTKIESEESQGNDSFRRDFMITLRASDPRFVSRKLYSISIVPSSFTLTFPGAGGFTFPADGSGIPLGAYLPTPVINLGRSPAALLVRFYGVMTNPVIYDPVSQRSIGINGTIASGDYIEFDTAKRTVVDSTGTSRYELLTDETSWPELAKGSNLFVLGADAVSGPGKVTFSYRHSSR